MSERKVLNKYFPPDFDPALIPRRKQPKDLQHKVRLMTPFSMRCNTCGEYIYKGKKFNARKETTEETYHNIKIFRFYIRCNRCAAEITFKTDPANTDYVAEKGAQRNFEPWRDVGAEIAAERQEEEENNPMKSLENRTQDSRREMEIMDALDEIRTKNAMAERVDADKALEKIMGTEQEQIMAKMLMEEEELDELARAAFKTADGETVKRLRDDDFLIGGENADGDLDATKIALSSFTTPVTLPDFKTTIIGSAAKKRKTGSLLGIVRKDTSSTEASTSKQTATTASTTTTSLTAKVSTPTSSSSTTTTTTKPSSALSALMGAYGSESDDSDAD